MCANAGLVFTLCCVWWKRECVQNSCSLYDSKIDYSLFPCLPSLSTLFPSNPCCKLFRRLTLFSIQMCVLLVTSFRSSFPSSFASSFYLQPFRKKYIRKIPGSRLFMLSPMPLPMHMAQMYLVEICAKTTVPLTYKRKQWKITFSHLYVVSWLTN